VILDKEPLRFGSYVRVSSSKQKAANTVEVQIIANQHLIESLQGELVDTFRDEAVSGYNRVASKRPEIQRLVQSVREGRINAIAFYDESRLSRQIIDFYVDVYAPIVAANPNVRFFKSSTGREWDPNSPEAKHEMVHAFEESDRKSRIAKQAQQFRFDHKHERPGARLPFGIRALTTTRIIPDSNFPLVLLIFELASWGYSERHIAEVLNQIAPKEGKGWSHTEVHYILYNPLYIGKIALNRRCGKYNGALKSEGEYLEFDAYAPLVPKSLWKLAHVELDKKSKDKTYRTQTSFLLTGLLRCANCGSEMKARNSTKANIRGERPTRTRKGALLRYYYCPTCEKRYDPVQIEQLVLGQIEAELGRNIEKSMIEKKLRSFIQHLKKRVRFIDEEIEDRDFILNRLQRGYYGRMFDPSTTDMLQQWCDELLADLYSEKRRVLKRIEELEGLCGDQDTLERLLRRAQCLTKVLPQHELRYLLLNTVESVYVATDKQNGPVVSELNFLNVPLPIAR
jgi:DNA invertase Pin-like site-specific DNA recombinase